MNKSFSNTYQYKFINISLLGVLLISVMLNACSQKEFIKPGDPVDVAFKKAMTFYENEDYQNAVEAYETVFRTARGTEFARESQFYLAQSYFKSQRYLLAASEFERYASLYPRSPNRQEAEFKEALSYYHLSPRYKIDQQYTRKAIEKFRLFNSRYPNSERVEEAANYITELRSKLANKLFSAAQLYLRTDRYEAAIIYLDLIVENYPETKWAEEGLVSKINAYNLFAKNSVRSMQQERYSKAVEAYERYIQLFPNGPNRGDAESYVDKARVALADLSEESESSGQQTSSN